MSSGERRQRTRQAIQDSIDHAKEEDRRNQFKQRLDMAKKGLVYFEAGKTGEALGMFLRYIQIVEEFKLVSPGGLKPSHFDFTKDIPELLLINGVYWNLAKAYDQNKSKESQELLRQYLNQYVAFSVGMPFQNVSAETVRKYLSNSDVKHPTMFREAYKRISTAKCFVATELVAEVQPVSVDFLRNYRDRRLNTTFFGKLFVRFYYFIGPFIARLLSVSPNVIRRSTAKFIDWFAKLMK